MNTNLASPIKESYRDTIVNKRAFIVDTIHRYCWQRYYGNIMAATETADKALKYLRSGCFVDTAIDRALSELDESMRLLK